MSKFKSDFPKISSLVLIVAGHRIQCGTVSSSSPQRGQVWSCAPGVHRQITELPILLFPTSVLNILVVSRVVYVVTQVVRFTVQSFV